jgi:hypothetical protein
MNNDPLARFDNQAVQSLAAAIATYTAWRLGRDEALTATGETRRQLQELQTKRARLVALRNSVTDFTGDARIAPANTPATSDAAIPTPDVAAKVDESITSQALPHSDSADAPPSNAPQMIPSVVAKKSKSDDALPDTTIPVTDAALRQPEAAPTPAPKSKKKSEDDLL